MHLKASSRDGKLTCDWAIQFIVMIPVGLVKDPNAARRRRVQQMMRRDLR